MALKTFEITRVLCLKQFTYRPVRVVYVCIFKSKKFCVLLIETVWMYDLSFLLLRV